MKVYFVLFFFLFNFFKELACLKRIATKKKYSFVKRKIWEKNGNKLIKESMYRYRLIKKNRVQIRCKVEGVEYTVRDLETSINFYKNVLNFRILKKEQKYAYLVLQQNPTYIKLLQNEDPSMRIGEHSFLGLGLQIKNFDITKTELFKGKIEEGIEQRPITACILPDEDAQTRRFWKNCFLLDPDGYGIEVVLEKDDNKFDRIRFFTTSTKDCQKFYADILGMELVKIQSHLEETSYPWNIFGGMSYFFSSPQKLCPNETQLQFAYAYDEDKLLMGNTYPKLILSFDNLVKIKKKLTEHDVELTQKQEGDDKNEKNEKNEKHEIYVKDFNGYHISLKQKKKCMNE